jgi:ketosteroid isomerase-like protein
MQYLTEDPSYVLIGLGLLALGLLIALKVTQQGKYLLWAAGVGVLAALVFAFEWFWVTDAERVEGVVYDLARAVEASDVDRIKSHLDDKVIFGMKGMTMDGSMPMRIVFQLLRRTRFDFVRIGQLTTSAGSQTKMGKAVFKVTATGVFEEGGSELVMPPLSTEWDLGFAEKSPGVWKVTRITAITVPPIVSRALFGR